MQNAVAIESFDQSLNPAILGKGGRKGAVGGALAGDTCGPGGHPHRAGEVRIDATVGRRKSGGSVTGQYDRRAQTPYIGTDRRAENEESGEPEKRDKSRKQAPTP